MAAGLLGGLSLGLLQVIKNVMNSQSRVTSIEDETEMAISVRMILENPNYCKMSLAGPDPLTNPVLFKKKDIDFAGVEINAGSNYSETSEGLNISLWYSNTAGDARSTKKFNGADNPGTNDKSQFSKIKILSIKLVMNNGIGTCSENYCPGNTDDMAQVVMIYEKKISLSNVRIMKKIFNLKIAISTDTTGESTLLTCHREEESVAEKPNILFY
jgi:hypothetical protein